MQVINAFLQIIFVSILIVVLFQLYKRQFVNGVNETNSVKIILKKVITIAIQVSLFWILWFVMGNLLYFLEWVYRHHSLDFNYWQWHGGMDGSLAFGIFTEIISFPIAFFIVKTLNIKL